MVFPPTSPPHWLQFALWGVGAPACRGVPAHSGSHSETRVACRPLGWQKWQEKQPRETVPTPSSRWVVRGLRWTRGRVWGTTLGPQQGLRQCSRGSALNRRQLSN